MRIQVVSKYLALAEEGLVSRLDCPLDQGLLMPNQDLDDRLFLYCLSCNYKKEIGIKFYEMLVDQVSKHI